MIGAHTMAIADGLQPDSDAYFAAIEQSLGMRASAQAQADPVSQASQAAPRRSAPPAAPVSRSGAPGTPANTVRLTAEEVDVARSLGMTPVDYAQHKRALIRDGRMKH
jgi:phage I-like protein